jgi:hypothetical protein
MKTNTHTLLRHPRRTSALLIAVMVLTLSVGAQAGKKGGGSGSPLCVTLDDQPGDTVRSDGSGTYCNNRSANVEVSLSTDGHLTVDTNNSNKTGAGRSLFYDFGQPISVVDGGGNVWTFQTTAQLDALGIKHDAGFFVGAFQDNFNLETMTLGEVRTDINVVLRLFVHFPGQRQETSIWIKLAPVVLDNNRQCEISDAARVTCTQVDATGSPTEWRVETQDPDNLACVSQDPYGHELNELSVGLIPMSFGVTVTR